MKLRTAFAILLLVLVPLSAHAAKKKKPLNVVVTQAASGLPLVTLSASDVPLSEVAERLAKELKTTVDVSANARKLRVTTELDEQPLDLTLRELAPQAYLDGIVTGGNGKTEIQTIYLRTAGETAPSLEKLSKRTSEIMMFYGNTEDPAIDPLKGKLEVTSHNGLMRVYARSEDVTVVVARIAEVLGLPVELIGMPGELVNISLADATLDQVLKALPSSVKLYQRLDLATFRVTPVRFVIERPFEMPKATP